MTVVGTTTAEWRKVKLDLISQFTQARAVCNVITLAGIIIFVNVAPPRLRSMNYQVCIERYMV